MNELSKIFNDTVNSYNLNELGSTINYIKSRGYNIVNINQLLDWFYVDVNDIISL